MTFDPTLANVFAFSAQIASLAAVASGTLALLRGRAPSLRYACWRLVLLMVALLPFLQPWHSMRTSSRDVTSVDVAVTAAAGSPAERLSDPGWPHLVVPFLAAGALLRLAWLGVGWRRLRRYRAAGQPVRDEDADDLQRSVGIRASCRYVAGLRHPVTFGLRPPMVLLPESLQVADADLRRAVLAHELWHARRRDWISVLVEEGIRAVLWFHPAVWWIIDRVRLAREEVVDQHAVALTGRRRDYLQALLAFADDRPHAVAAAFGRRRHLYQRMLRIAREDVMSSTRIVASSAIFAVVVLAAIGYGIRAFPLTAVTVAETQQSGPGPVERTASPATPDNPVPGRVHEEPAAYPTDPSARVMSARVTVRATIDHVGTVVEARPVGFEFATNDQLRAAIHGDDRAARLDEFLNRTAFRSTPGAPQVAASRLRPAIDAFVQSAVTSVLASRYGPPAQGPLAFDVTVHFAGPRVTQGVDPDSPLAVGALRVGGNISPPKKIQDVRPVYPPEAQAAGVQGVVIMEARIEGDGSVSQARVLRSIPGLDEAALDAVRHWRFTPTLLNGVPTPVVMVVTIQFTLQ